MQRITSLKNEKEEREKDELFTFRRLRIAMMLWYTIMAAANDVLMYFVGS